MASTGETKYKILYNTFLKSSKDYSNFIHAKSKNEIQLMIDAATDEADRNVVKTNEEFHIQMENRKKNTEDRIRQMKNQALKDIKNASVRISIQAVETLLKNSLDKNKLNKIFTSSIEETKTALKRKST